MVVVNLLAVCAYLFSLVYIIQTQRKYSLFFAFVSIYQLWALVSCFYNDLGIYNLELFSYTTTSLATTRLALFCIIFNIGFLLAAKLVGKHILTRREYKLVGETPNLGAFKLIFMVGIAGLVVYEAYSLTTNGTPLFTGIDREAFSREAGFVNWIVLAWGAFIAFILGMTRKEEKLFCVQNLLIALIIIYAILTGHKFSMPSSILILYYMPICMRRIYQNPSWNPFRVGILARIFVVCLIFGGSVYGIYSSKLEDNDLAQALITQRVLAMQGEIWWAIDNEISSSGTYDTDHWKDELSYIISSNETTANEVGMRYLMIKMLGGEKAFTIFDSGYLYTMAYPAILIMTFSSVVALLIQFLAGLFFFILVYYLYYCVAYSYYVRAIVALSIIMPFTTVMGTGNLFVFFTIGMLIKIGLLITLESVPLGIFRQSDPVALSS